MENNRSYLEKLGIVFLVSLFSGLLLTILITQFGFQRAYNRTTFLSIVIVAISILTLLTNIGLLTKKWNGAAGMAVAFILVQLLSYFDYGKYSGKNPGTLFIIGMFVSSIPYFVFFLFTKTERRKLPVIFLCTLLLVGVGGISHADDGFREICDLFSKNWNIPDYIFRFFTLLVVQLLIAVLIAELNNYAEGKAAVYHPRLINPGNEYGRLNATIIYWTFKCFICLSLLGCFAIYRSYINHADNYGTSLSWLKWYHLFGLVSTTLLMLVTAWYLRKFMLEFFISYNLSSRVLFWFLQLPVVGFFAWVVMLADCEKQETFAQRKKTLEEFSSNSRNGVIIILSILLVLRFLFSIEAGPLAAVITLFLSCILFIALISSTGGYYFNFYLNILLLALFIVLPTFKSSMNIGPLLYPLLLMNVVQLVLVYPVLHFEAFDYVSYEEEKPWEPGQDLFG